MQIAEYLATLNAFRCVCRNKFLDAPILYEISWKYRFKSIF